MDSNKTHNPVFLVFPPQVTVPEFQSTNSTVTTVESRIPFPKLLSTKMKIFGFINSGAFLVALERTTTDVLMKMSRTMNFFSALAATIGIILLVFGFILDQNYFCGYAEEISECKPVTTLFIGILIMLMALSIIEFLVSTSFSFLSRAFDCCNCEEWC
ncbi:membrane-spanning 4-domains subfamily A member 5 [Pteropus vampyrus]|uniref:Membrane-spanning 4-domains subfamily A member 5 n=1 Tax=Pteropus vampyrus TaxID=132908 RepID=A0A6P3RQ74_PTEVA|nr:membrane-spanning 4-domains subfamily A member 5 [Pteropus vampyrus]